MRTAPAKVAIGLGYVAVLLWVGWVGVADDGDIVWTAVEWALFWVAWLGGSIAAGLAFERVESLFIPPLTSSAVLSYVALWPDTIENEVWLLNLALVTVVSTTFLGLGIGLGRRRASKHKRPAA